MQKSLSYIMSGRKIYTSKTVDELLFTGYSDTLLTMGKIMASDEVPAFDRFGWFYMVCLSATTLSFSLFVPTTKK